MLIKGATPPADRRAASFVLPDAEPEIKRARSPWTPARHGWDLGSCGHICADDSEIKAIRAVTSALKGTKVWCDKCECFVTVVVKASALRRLGLVPLPSPDTDEPPF